MKGSPKIIELLNNALTKELTAINQYFIHSKMCENWGYLALAKKYYAAAATYGVTAARDRLAGLNGFPETEPLPMPPVSSPPPQ